MEEFMSILDRGGIDDFSPTVSEKREKRDEYKRRVASIGQISCTGWSGWSAVTGCVGWSCGVSGGRPKGEWKAPLCGKGVRYTQNTHPRTCKNLFVFLPSAPTTQTVSIPQSVGFPVGLALCRLLFSS